MASPLRTATASVAIALSLTVAGAGYAGADNAPGSEPPATTSTKHRPPGVLDPNCYLQSGDLTRSAGNSIGRTVGTMIGNTIFLGTPGGRAWGRGLGETIGGPVGTLLGFSVAGILACPNQP